MFLENAYALNIGRLSVPVPPKIDYFGRTTRIETMVVNIPINMIKSHLESGLYVKLVGSRGSISFPVSGYYIQGFLEAAKK